MVISLYAIFIALILLAHIAGNIVVNKYSRRKRCVIKYALKKLIIQPFIVQ